jgi:ureidoacrylate peracid hydrolase
VSVEQLDPAQSALLVIDMQNAFCHPEGTLGISGVDTGPAREAIPLVARLAKRCDAAGVPVIWTRQVHLPADASRAHKRLATHTQRRKRVSALAGSWDAQLVEELRPLADDPDFVVTKHRFGCFHESRLELLLRMLGTRALLVAGVTENACVETTIREAYLRDYDVVAVSDCIAPVRADWREITHAVWQQYLCELATSEEVVAWLDRSAAPGIEALGHLLLETTDLDRAERFYAGALGLKVRKRERFRDGRPLIVTEQGLGLTEGGTGQGGQVDHIAFRTRGVRELAERLAAEGVEIVRGPEPGAYGLSLYVVDPDGNEIELFGPDDSVPGEKESAR